MNEHPKRFERMITSLLGFEPSNSAAALFGIGGQRQFGVDGVAQRRDGVGIEVVSCKCYQSIRAAQVRKWSDEFLDFWADIWAQKKVQRFIIATAAADVTSHDVQRQFEVERNRFAALGIIYEVWGPEEIVTRLQRHRPLANRFLGPMWAGLLCGGDSFSAEWEYTLLNRLRRLLLGDDESRNLRDKRLLCQKVKVFWIDGVLRRSLDGHFPISLAMARSESDVEQPWSAIAAIDPGDGSNAVLIGKRIDDVFREATQSLLILGDPGAGKTTALLELAQSYINKFEDGTDQVVPVIFNLSSWVEKKETLHNWLLSELNNKYQIPQASARSWIEHGELLLLLDGLDEVPTAQRTSCINAINLFRLTHGFSPICVCSRADDYRSVEVRLILQSSISLLSLSDQQIDLYLSQGNFVAARSLIERDGAIKELARSPLILNILCHTGEQGQHVAQSTSETKALSSGADGVFDMYVERMFRRRPRTAISSGTIGVTLGWLAHQMSLKARSVFLIEELQPNWLASSPQRWLYALSSRLLISLILCISVLPLVFVAFTWSIVQLTFLIYLVPGLVFGVRDGWGYRTTGKAYLMERARPRSLPFSLFTSFVIPVLLIAPSSLIFLFFGGDDDILLLFFGLLLFLSLSLLTDAALSYGIPLVWTILALGSAFAMTLGPVRGRVRAGDEIKLIEHANFDTRIFFISTAAALSLAGAIGLFAGVSANHPAKLWTSAGMYLASLYRAGGSVERIKVSPNGEYAALLTSSQTLAIYAVDDGSRYGELRHGLNSSPITIVFGDDSQRVLVNGQGQGAVWDMKQRKTVFELKGNYAVNPSVDRILTRNYESEEWKLWNVTDGSVVASISVWDDGGDRVVFSDRPVFSPDGSRFGIVSGKGEIQLRSSDSGALITVAGFADKWTHLILFTPDSTRFLTVGLDRNLKLWDARDGRLISTLTKEAGLFGYQSTEQPSVRTIQFAFNMHPIVLSGDGRRVLAGHYGNRLTIWDVSDGSSIAELVNPRSDDVGQYYIPRLNKRGDRVIACVDDGESVLWDGTTGNILKRDKEPMTRFLPEGDRFITSSKTGRVVLWDARTASMIATLQKDIKEHESCDNEYPISDPTGSRLLTVINNGTILLWDAENGKKISQFKPSGTANERLPLTAQQLHDLIEHLKRGFSDNGKLFYVIYGRGGGFLLNAQNGSIVANFGDVSGAAFAQQDRRVVTATSRGAVISDYSVWSIGVLLIGMILGALAAIRASVVENKIAPNEGIIRSFKNAVRMGLIASVFTAGLLAIAFAVGGELSYDALMTCAAVALAFGVPTALTAGGTAVIQHFVVRGILASFGVAPMRVSRVLDGASELILLRKVGGGYIFIHRRLLEYFDRQCHGAGREARREVGSLAES